MTEWTAYDTFLYQGKYPTAFSRFGTIEAPKSYVFYFHGLPSSRLEGALFDGAASRLHVQIIAIDRPGIGRSEEQPGRTLLDWSPVVAELAAHLDISEFYVLGSSAGGPYALACARKLPVRQLKGAGVVAGMAPTAFGLEGMAWTQRMAVYATQWTPRAGIKLYDWLLVPRIQNMDEATSEKLVQQGLQQMGSRNPQMAARSDAAVRCMIAALSEHFRRGTAGLPDEWRNFVTNWGFDLREVPPSVPVTFWCGVQDTYCPCAGSRKMAACIEQSTLVEYADTTHHTILIERSEEILQALISG